MARTIRRRSYEQHTKVNRTLCVGRSRTAPILTSRTMTRLTPLEATINFMGGHGMRIGRTREFAMLLRAGAIIPRGMDLPPYLDAIAKAGGYERYERAHRTRLAAIFIPKFPRVPAEIIPTIVAFWADCGGH